MFGWILNIVYLLAGLVISPLWLYRMLRHGRYRTDWGQRLGAAPVRYGLQPVIWIHGVSVGEISAARTLLDQLHAQLPDYQVVFSSTTDTGMATARRMFAPDHKVFRFPLDFTFTVNRALRRLRPDLLVLMEGDVWPNLVSSCRKRGIPAVVVNGRIGPAKGYPRYRRVRPVAAWLFNNLTAIGLQHESYAELYARLGVRKEKLVVTGMLKFDTADLADRVAGQEELAAAMGISQGQKLIVAGGTGAGEESLVLDAFAEATAGLQPPARLAIVPRKPERFDEVARLIQSRGLGCVRRSQRPDGGASPGANDAGAAAILLGDTMGELRKFYALSDGCFVGRSLVPEGGSDMIEAAALGKCVAFGPHTFNFPQAQFMVDAGAACRVQSPKELTALIRQWLSDRAAAGQLGRAAQQYVAGQRGATHRNMELICRVLGRVSPPGPGTIATDAIDHPTTTP